MDSEEKKQIPASDEKEHIPAVIRQITDQEAWKRTTVSGWKSAGGRWRKSRAMDVLTNKAGRQVLEIKMRKEYILVPVESIGQ